MIRATGRNMDDWLVGKKKPEKESSLLIPTLR